jgi:hypothetical protein
MRSNLLCLLSLVFLLTMGCTFGQPESEAMYQRSAELSKVTSILTACLQDPDGPPPSLADRALVESCLNRVDRIDLLDNFKGNVIRTRIWQFHAVLLVCDQNEQKALWEDVSCTGEFEKHHWQAQPSLPCAFTLDPEVVCR